MKNDDNAKKGLESSEKKKSSIIYYKYMLAKHDNKENRLKEKQLTY